jgi:hypothetical protein
MLENHLRPIEDVAMGPELVEAAGELDALKRAFVTDIQVKKLVYRILVGGRFGEAGVLRNPKENHELLGVLFQDPHLKLVKHVRNLGVFVLEFPYLRQGSASGGDNLERQERFCIARKKPGVVAR